MVHSGGITKLFWWQAFSQGVTSDAEGTSTEAQCDQGFLQRLRIHLPVPFESDLNRHADRNKLAVWVLSRLEPPRLHYVDCSTIKGGVETIDQANLVSLSLDRDQNSQKDLSFRAAASLPHWVFWSSERVEDAVRAYRELDKLRISIVKATGVCERVDCASIYCGFVVWGYE
jgi:hypothetical protein